MNYLPLFMYTHEAATVSSWKCYPNLPWQLEQTHLGSAFWRQWNVAWLSTFWLYDSRWCIYLPNSVSSSVKCGHQSRCSGIWHGGSWRRVGGHPWRLDELETLPISQTEPYSRDQAIHNKPLLSELPLPTRMGRVPGCHVSTALLDQLTGPGWSHDFSYSSHDVAAPGNWELRL